MIDGMIPCHSSNYSKGRAGKIQYIVLHYTGNDGDTAKGNCNYFSGANRSASAHYFVDEKGIWQSVAETDTAWHCGTTGAYRHGKCRNANSIGIEMCSRRDGAGNYYIKAETVANAVKLARSLMGKYGISAACILRHSDVTGKECPRPWVRDENQWRAFLGALTKEEDKIMTYEQWKEFMDRYEREQAAAPCPAWGKAQWDEATEKGIVDGSRPMASMTRVEYAVSELRRLEG